MNIALKTILIVGFGGFIGAVLRMVLVGVFNRNIHWHTIAIGTLGVNLLGSFLIGVLFALSTKFHISVELRSFIQTGLLGALTTYSTFALENFIMLQNQQYVNLFLNASANLFGTLLALMIGYYLVKLLF